MNDKRNTIAYKVGQLMATSVALCAAALLVAVTVRLILWMF